MGLDQMNFKPSAKKVSDEQGQNIHVSEMMDGPWSGSVA